MTLRAEDKQLERTYIRIPNFKEFTKINLNMLQKHDDSHNRPVLQQGHFNLYSSSNYKRVPQATN